MSEQSEQVEEKSIAPEKSLPPVNSSTQKLTFSNLFSLLDDTDVTGTVDTIQKGIAIKGVNVWMLFAAAMLASIGLDTNSTAVIIGAMLVSPLMSPILGVGLGVGIYDRYLLTDSLKNFSVAILLSLLVSISYFLVTPLGDVTNELTARTSPTLLDVGVALFGGIAGIVAGSRKEKTNAIPGVAIATALMPPLCTAGFGIATGRPKYFFGAFYLFFLNAVFISLATFFIVRILQFPYREFATVELRKKMRRWIITFSIIVIIPSGVIFYGVIKELRLNKKIQLFIAEKVNNGQRSAIRWEVVSEDANKVLKIYLFGEPFTEEQKVQLKSQLINYSLGLLQLSFIQMNVAQDERQRLSSEIELSIMQKVANIQKLQETKDKEKLAEIEQLQLEIKQLKVDTQLLENIKSELKILFPEVLDMLYVPKTNLVTSQTTSFSLVVIFLDKNTKAKTQAQLKEKLTEYLKERLGNPNLQLLLILGNPITLAEITETTKTSPNTPPTLIKEDFSK